ncbi:LysR family transcriptional regulator [Luteibacter sp. CQ10]|uniref:LysR family transcriptional regulator n=1 Tax=Luteibacter sp. CQ10 TaxID=2805821 RepID=UPI0034A5B64D
MHKAGLVELQAVLAVATHHSFRRAAVAVGMSPSALSHAVAMLERRMGVRLFHRTTRSVSLSEAGEQFVARVRPALGEIAAAMDDANAFRETPTGTLRINTSEGAAMLLADAILFEYVRRYPEMRLDVVTEGRFVDIVAEGFDAGIRATDQVPQDMVAVRCTGRLRFLVVGSPGYFKGRRKPRVPEDLRRHTCIRSRLPSGKWYPWDFEKRGEERRIDVDGPLGFDSDHLMLAAALDGMGLIWTVEARVAPYIEKGLLTPVLEDWCPYFDGLSVYYPAHRHMSAGLRAFLDLVRERRPS